MYEQVFHFNSRPFTATPYVKHYFAGDAIHQALAQARLCIDRGSGPVIAIGATGTGKSLLLAMLEEQYQSQFNVVNLGCARLDQRCELLQSVLYELQLPFKDLSETELRFALIDYLKPSQQCPNGVLLLVDEAHSLSAEMLDEIRLITNVVRDGQPRVRLVMAGNQILEENLNDSKLESFNQRIAARSYLNNMSRDETARYVTEHIDRAGGDGAQLFRKDSLRAIHDVSDGCPRLINQVCDHALILTATRGEHEITAECIQESWADVQSIPGSFNPKTAAPAAVADLKNNENWTVIEFGKLDENDAQTEPETENGTTHELERSTEEPSSEQSDSIIASSADVQDTIPAMENHDIGQEIESTEIGNDWQDSEEQQEETQLSDVESEADNEEADIAEHVGPSDDVKEFAEMAMSSDIQAPEQSELDSQTAEASATESSELAAQLADVSEDEPENELELNSKNSDISDLELEQSQILEQVELERANIFGTEEDSEKLAPIADNVADEYEESSVDSPDNLHANNDLVDDQAHVDAEPVSESTMDTQDQEPALADADSASFDTNSHEADETHAEQHESEEFEEINPKLRQPVETVDPFDESFAEEETLIDRYAPFVAQQNQSSLTVTSEDLAQLTPDDELEQNEPNSPAIFHTDHGETHPTQSDSELSSADVEPDYEGDDYPTDQSDETVSNGEAPANQHELTDEIEANPSVFESVVKPEPGSDADHESACQLDSETMGEADSENFIQASEAGTDQVEETVTHDIQTQAEEILARLSESQHASGESPPHEIENENSAYLAASSENTDLAGEQELETMDSNSSPQAEPVDSEYIQQSAALDESQQILNEILEQRHALAQQREMLSAGQSTAPTDSYSETGESVSDQEMIIVNRMEQQSESSTLDVDTQVPFPTTPVSTGRAERMDYQKLFDQLREISDPKK